MALNRYEHMEEFVVNDFPKKVDFLWIECLQF